MNTFKEMGLNLSLLQAVEDLGFKNPSAVQQQAIPKIINSDRDLIALAQTGTGKTAAFGLPILEQLSSFTKSVQAIIICPTRELCLQITKDLESYSKYLRDIKVQAVYGGADAKKQIDGLKRNPQIVVGTPGRTLDLINRKALKINDIKWVVLDEADEMLNMGFREDIDLILESTPQEKQTLLFSATMPKDVRRIASQYMHNPDEVSIGKTNQASNNVEHQFYMVRASNRYLALKRIADINPHVYGIVFCRTRREAKDVADRLIQDGYNADALHGDLSQAQRDTVMEKFRRGQLQLLVATDVAARGIDINELTHVINYNLPDDPEVYVHRSGRTGRAGNQGVSIIIAHSREGRRIRELERLIQKPIVQKQVPTGEEIVGKRLYASIEKIEKIEVDEAQIAPFMDTISAKLSWMDRDELLRRFVSMEFNTYLKYYQNAPDLNELGSTKGEERDSKRRRSSKGYTRFFIGRGKKNRMKAPNLIGLINDMTNTKDISIGEIEILRNFSFFEADSEFEDLILKSFEKSEYLVQISKPVSNGSNRRRGERRQNDSFRGGRNRFGADRKRSNKGKTFSRNIDIGGNSSKGGKVKKR